MPSYPMVLVPVVLTIHLSWDGKSSRVMHGVLGVQYNLNAHHKGRLQQVDIPVEIDGREFDGFALCVTNIEHE